MGMIHLAKLLVAMIVLTGYCQASHKFKIDPKFSRWRSGAGVPDFEKVKPGDRVKLKKGANSILLDGMSKFLEDGSPGELGEYNARADTWNVWFGSKMFDIESKYLEVVGRPN